MHELENRIWWHLYPLGAAGAPPRRAAQGDQPWEGHRLRRLEPWLDYAADLGFTGILLGPIFESTSHGYDTLDHFRLDPRLGDESDWASFVARAQERDLAIMLDGVFNHLGADHPLAQDPSWPGLKRDEHGRPLPWEGHDALVELDHSRPEVHRLVQDVMTHWLGRGASGWRLDVAYAVPSEFWAAVLPVVRERHPAAMFLGEVIHGDYARIATAGTLDAVTQYELWKAIWSAQKDMNLFELGHALGRHADFSREAGDAVMQTFVGNHDVPRIASTVGDAGAALSAIMLFALPGMPSVYYGDEQAFRGEKADGYAADDPLRPPLPDSPEELSGQGRWLAELHHELASLRGRCPWLTRGQVRVEHTENELIRFATIAEHDRLDVEIALAPAPRARLILNGQTVLEWAG